MRFLLLILVLINLNPSSALDPVQDLKILSAEKLDYKDGDSTLIGNVKIKLGEYIISAPKVFVDSNKEGRPIKARFIEGVSLDSEKLQIKSPSMEIDVINSLFKCFSDDTVFVETKIYKNKSNKKEDLSEAVIYSWYQEYNIATGFAKALATDEAKEILTDKEKLSYQTKLKNIVFLAKDLNIRSKTIELQNNDGNLDYIDFIGDAVAVDTAQRTEANELFYFPAQDLIKAQDDVRILYAQSDDEKFKNPAYIFSDLVIYERKQGIFSAFSNSLEARSEIRSGESYGRSRQIITQLDKDNKFDNAILTGKAYTQHKDKSVLGHEILFDFKNKEMQSLVGRPQTQILSKNTN